MEKWICEVCGYTHQGDEAPEMCPKCGASKSKFYAEKKGRGCGFGILFIVVMLLLVCLSFFSCSSSLF